VQAGRRRRLQIPPHRLRIQPDLGRHPFLRQSLAPKSEIFLEFDHRDLAKHQCLLGWAAAQPRRLIARSGEGERVLKNPAPKGGKVLKNLSSEGGKVLTKSSGKGPYVLRTDTPDPLERRARRKADKRPVKR